MQKAFETYGNGLHCIWPPPKRGGGRERSWQSNRNTPHKSVKSNIDVGVYVKQKLKEEEGFKKTGNKSGN